MPPESLLPDESNSSNPQLEIDQSVRGDRNQTLGQMSGGTAIASVEGSEIHIGNRIYQADPETVKRIVREELTQILHHSL